jgi:hypothetical protein
MRAVLTAFASLAIFLAVLRYADAQTAVVSVLVIDDATDAPLAGVRVSIVHHPLGHRRSQACARPIDGHLREWGFAVNSIAPEEIHGIEVYPGPGTIPAEYASMSRDSSCGLIAIWTRRDK